MKMLLLFLLVGIIVIVVIRSLRNERSAVVRRRVPGPDLPARYDTTDASYLGTSAFGSDSSHHGHHHGADCAPSHDSGGSVDCGSDGGGGSGDGGGGGSD